MSDQGGMRPTRFSSRLKRYSLDNDNVLPREVNQVRPKRSDARRATAPVPDTKRNANGKSNFDNNPNVSRSSDDEGNDKVLRNRNNESKMDERRASEVPNSDTAGASASVSNEPPNSNNNKAKAKNIATVNKELDSIKSVINEQAEDLINICAAFSFMNNDVASCMRRVTGTLMALFSVLTLPQVEEIKAHNETGENSMLTKFTTFAEDHIKAKSEMIRGVT